MSVAVIAVLVSILLPALASARESGRAAVCQSNVRQLLLGADLYAGESKGLYPAGSPDRLANLTRWHGARAVVSGAFSPDGGTLTAYLGEGAGAGVRECPSFSLTLRALADQGLGFERSCGGYAYNNEFMGTMRQRVPGGLSVVSSDLVGSARWLFQTPSRTIAFADGAFASTEARACGMGNVIEYSFAEPRFWPDNPTYRADPSMHFRHRGIANVAWQDGHTTAERMRYSWSSGLYGVEAADVGIGWTGATDDNSLYDYE